MLECCPIPTAIADYVLENNTTSQLLIELSDSNRAMNFTVQTIDDITLEDYEESFGITISLENPSVLANINGDQSSFNITILDNEGKCGVLQLIMLTLFTPYNYYRPNFLIQRRALRNI